MVITPDLAVGSNYYICGATLSTACTIDRPVVEVLFRCATTCRRPPSPVAVRVRKTCLAQRCRRILPLCRWARCRGPHGVQQTLLRSTRVSTLCERGAPVCSNGPGRPPSTWVRAGVATVRDTIGATLAVRCGASRLVAPAQCSDASLRCTLAPPGGARPRRSRCWRRSNNDTSVLSGCG